MVYMGVPSVLRVLLSWIYKWEKGFLLHSIVDSKQVELVGIVIPKCRRSQLLALAHDKAGHLSDKKLLEIFKRRFSWPNITCDVHKYVKSCVVCQRANKKGHLRAPMVERPVVSEPFEVVAVDIVGPLPKVADMQLTILFLSYWLLLRVSCFSESLCREVPWYTKIVFKQ